ncbi:hypothetical protein [Muricomes intestini]|jgi:hypothetical protein|uniref:Uncharacterized protein n=1 Tax=Muricomes intestini TaxID=1796634 RepID=A0A4R3KA19_9FIRM|nr:hypothetical protein EDD59_10774 [Muricomes intestini]
MERKVKNQAGGFRTQDGAGVHLVRVLSNTTVEEYDPIVTFIRERWCIVTVWGLSAS